MLSQNSMQYLPQLNEAVDLLLSRVPEFAEARSRDASFMSYEDDSPYLIFGDFGLFLREQLKNKPRIGANEDWLRASAHLIDKMLTSSDPEVANLIQVGVLEVLSDYPTAINLVKSYLSVPGQEKFDDWARISQVQTERG
jgi:hypothetical protein